MQRTNIEYLDYTWNPTHGCSPVSEGCQNCWAAKISKRLAGVGAIGYSKDDPFKVTCIPDKLNEPLNVKKPSRIGVSFMGDLFCDEVPFTFLTKIMVTISHCKQHTFLLLTKRPENMAETFRDIGAPDNCWLGVSVENQRTADERIPILLEIPASVRFLSCEPLLEEINLKKYLHCGISWCIFGSESGKYARLMNEEWVRKGVEQCKKEKIPIFYKQIMVKKKLIKMPLLDGRRYAEYPETLSLKEK